MLVVDASQGVEAQTVANCYNAIEQDLVILPVLNKMDLPQADPVRACEEIEDIIGLDATDAVQISAKTGLNVKEVLERVVRDVPPPDGDPEGPLKALIVDSWFDSHVGVVSLVRVFSGKLKERGQDPGDVDWPDTASGFRGVVYPESGEWRGTRLWAGRVRDGGHSRHRGCSGGGYDHAGERRSGRRHCRGFGKCSRRCLRACFRWMPMITSNCGMRWRNSG